jgi:hypothetical protein
MIRRLVQAVASSTLVELLISPLVVLGSILLLLIRKIGVDRMTISRRIFETVGVFPIADHYYEPLFNSKRFRVTAGERDLPGIDWNDAVQLELLAKFTFQDELQAFRRSTPGTLAYSYENENFVGGDADLLYSMIRHLRPSRMIEVGSGYSTLAAAAAFRRNQQDDPSFTFTHVCIEPYEMPWLAELPVTVIRERVETLDRSVFASLNAGDILFIDSSHVIRPQGDVTFEMLDLLPRLSRGVYVHFHDIFSPRDYPAEWVRDRVLFWNEQYLLEAFLSFNGSFEIVAALNYLQHRYPERVRAAFPILGEDPSLEPGSFWIRRRPAS